MRTTLLHTATALTALVAIIPIGTEVATSTEPHVLRVETSTLPPALAELAERAVQLFDEAGLDLPVLRFSHHGEDRDPCSGWKGVHRYEDGVSEIGLCTDESGPAIEWLVLHETAHAWAAHSLTDERRRAFQQLRGLEHWRADKWHESGSEHAAEILAWGLIDRPAGIVTIPDHSCDDLEAGYRALTGEAPLHGYRDYCVPRPPVANISPGDDPGSHTSEPDLVADHLGGIAARLHNADGTAIAGDVFLLMGTDGSTKNARLYDRTPYTHGFSPHPDTIASNLMALRTIRTLTGADLEPIEFTNAPGGGPSGGITRAIAYLNVISDGAFTGELRVAATGRLEAGGHLGPIDHIDAKTAAAHLAGADVLFSPTVPTESVRNAYGARLVGELVRETNTGGKLHDSRRLDQFHRWGARRPSGTDVVDARHLIDVASYLCGTGSTYACDITDLLDQEARHRHAELQDEVRSESERFRAKVMQRSASLDA